ncbi:hypothetical protein GLYMA_04G079000v4 [Glycine max]|uniref:Uncharacterized protein n=1 Tax=Glycine max TaxID=3847 RepID=A0A0R0K5N4_SOYBN|nr:hypothetical protein GLYMA_04G079000v4 [Glycine max]
MITRRSISTCQNVINSFRHISGQTFSGLHVCLSILYHPGLFLLNVLACLSPDIFLIFYFIMLDTLLFIFLHYFFGAPFVSLLLLSFSTFSLRSLSLRRFLVRTLFLC